MTQEAIRLIYIKHGPDDRVTYVLNEEAVEKHFLTDDLRHVQIAAISIAGKAREGKSFMMDLLLRYALHRYKKGIEDDTTWLNDGTVPLEGFTPKSSSNRQTSGIMVWPELFVGRPPDRDKVALLLMDTQGIIDGRSPASEWAKVFSLSTMVSSLQLYNVMTNITEQCLENLEFFCAYSQMIAPITSGKSPYQNIMFLVRDFKYREIYGLGLTGGEKHITDQFDAFTSIQMLSWNRIQYVNQHIEVRKNIESFFENIYCCCLPDPGRVVTENKNFDGKLKPVNYIFKDEVKKFVPQIMAPDQLIARRIDGDLMTVTRLFSNLRDWVNRINQMNLPEPKTIYLATAENDHYAALEAAMRVYNTKMIAAGCMMDYMKKKRLQEAHEDAQDKAIAYFNSVPKMGNGDMVTDIFREKLELAISKRYYDYCAQNQSKNLSSIILVPLICMTGFLLCVFVQFLLTTGVIDLPYMAYQAAWWMSWVSAVMFFLWFKDMFQLIAEGWWEQTPLRYVWYGLVNVVRSIRILFAIITIAGGIAIRLTKLTLGRP